MMRSWIFALVALGASLALGTPGRDTAKELITNEQVFNQALIHGDWKTAETLLAEDLVFTDSDATVSGKSDQITGIKSGDLRLESIEMSEVKVQDLGNVGIVTGKLIEKGRYKNADAGGVYRFTDVWARRNGTWLLVTGQETRKAQPN